MEFCRFFRSVKFVARSLGRFLGRGVCLWLQRLQLSKLTDQLLFRPNNTFHFRLLDIGDKFEKKIGNKTANNKRKRKDKLGILKFIAAIMRSRAKVVIF